jgi:hypothetical protein
MNSEFHNNKIHSFEHELQNTSQSVSLTNEVNAINFVESVTQDRA